MMKHTVILIFALSFLKASGQSADDLKQYPVKKGIVNVSFTKEFSRIVKSYSHNFAELKNDDRIISIIDTVYNIKLNFKEAHDGTLTFAKEYISLGINFGLDAVGLKKLLDDLNSSFPPGFVYTYEYDAAAKLSYYTFFKDPGVKADAANYPEKISLSVDVDNTASLGFFKFR
ncbi:MAG TPA: hypothetical protein VGN20_25425 [Mucilaginibacter sp.]|jgi:hypothetical protein